MRWGQYDKYQTDIDMYQHEEVQQLIQQSIERLQEVSDFFLTTIAQSLDKIP
jgi:hypothetical protein